MNESKIKEDLLLQEYKSVKDRIGSFEARREQMVFLSITATAAILGFGDKIVPWLIPPLVLAILLLSSFNYTQHLVLQHMTTAYIIERFESNFPAIQFESGFYSIALGTVGKPAFKKAEWAAISPYAWLTIMSAAISVIWSRKFLAGLQPEEVPSVLLGLYFGGLVLGHALVCYGLYLQTARHIPYFSERWREHFARHGSTNVETQNA